MALAWSLCSSCVVVWVEYIITLLNLWEGGTGKTSHAFVTGTPYRLETVVC